MLRRLYTERSCNVGASANGGSPRTNVTPLKLYKKGQLINYMRTWLNGEDTVPSSEQCDKQHCVERGDLPE